MLRFFLKLLACCLLLLGASGAYVYFKVEQPLVLVSEKVEFQIATGSGLRSATHAISRAGVDIHPLLLEGLGRLMGAESSIKAGFYEVSRGMNARDLLQKLLRGEVMQSDIAFIEGWTFRQMREKLDAHPDLRHDSKSMNDAEILRRVGANAKEAEGLFFPNTYLFARQTSDLDILQQAYRLMQTHLGREWQGRDENLPYRDPYQALIMASLIEKETGREADRSLVAAVFVNRLRQGMLLQTDPSVIYGLGANYEGRLHKRDLQTDTPYNTYTSAGLPPTPIAAPGLASLRAALHPALSTALYFVARGDGSSHFSETLDEHNNAVNRYIRGIK